MPWWQSSCSVAHCMGGLQMCLAREWPRQMTRRCDKGGDSRWCTAPCQSFSCMAVSALRVIGEPR